MFLLFIHFIHPFLILFNFFLITFTFYCPVIAHLLVHPPTVPHSTPPHLCLQEDISLSPQLSPLLGASNLLRVYLLPLRPDEAILCCMCVGGLLPASVCCLVGVSLSERSCTSMFVKTAVFPVGWPSSSTSSSLSLIQPQGSQT